MTNTAPPIDCPALALVQAREDFFARFDAFCAVFCEREGKAPGHVSRKLFGSPRRVDELRGGADIGVLRLAEAERALAALAKDAGITLPAGEREEAA